MADQRGRAWLLVLRFFEKRFESAGGPGEHVRLDAASHQFER
jgi:hypothetical protein